MNNSPDTFQTWNTKCVGNGTIHVLTAAENPNGFTAYCISVNASKNTAYSKLSFYKEGGVPSDIIVELFPTKIYPAQMTYNYRYGIFVPAGNLISVYNDRDTGDIDVNVYGYFHKGTSI